MAWGRARIGRVGVAAVVALVLVLGLVASRVLDGASASPAASPSTKAGASAAAPNLAKRLLLRLHDLPLGYLVLNLGLAEESNPLFGCTRIVPADPRPRLASFLERYSPRGCLAVYYRLFRVPGSGPAPLLVGSAAADLGSVEAAEAGMTISRELLAHLTGDELPDEVQPPEAIGEATRLFHWREARLLSDEEAVSILVWRWGGSVGLVLIGGDTFAATDSAAVELARRQQRHLEAPTPYTPAERDDTEVALEDPALQVPVYWLGDAFSPDHGFPRLGLRETFSTTRRSREPRATLLYADRLTFEHAETVELDLWTPQQWKKRRARDRLPFEMECTKTHGLDLPTGHAVIYAGREPGWRCGARGERAYAAVIRFPGVVVTAETREICEECSGAADGPYNSFRGMATIARGLAPRLVSVSSLGPSR